MSDVAAKVKAIIVDKLGVDESEVVTVHHSQMIWVLIHLTRLS